MNVLILAILIVNVLILEWTSNSFNSIVVVVVMGREFSVRI
jgi:hypothetical protein